MLNISTYAFASASQEVQQRTGALTKFNERKINSVLRSAPTIALFVYFVWVWVGILWYMYYNDWTMGTSYFYALEAGLSIGFCNPVEKDDYSKLFTIFYVVVGSTLVSGCLGALTTQIFYTRVKIAPVDYVHGMVPYRDPDTQKITPRTLFNFLWFEFKLTVGWYHYRSRVMTLVVFIIWIGLGTAYCIVVEKWSFISSLYW